MTAEEFLEYIESAKHYRDKGKARLRRARENYAAYVQAYRQTELRALCSQARLTTYIFAVLKAAEDRDAGRPMVSVPELL